MTIQIPSEIGHLPESTSAQQVDSSLCSWKLFKTLNASGIGMSQVETQQLDQTMALYQQVTKRSTARTSLNRLLPSRAICK